MHSAYKIFIAAIIVFCCHSSLAQNNMVRLKSRGFTPEKNIRSFNYAELVKSNSGFNGKVFTIIQFSHTVTSKQKQQLSEAGIELYQYIPNNAFTAVIRKNVEASLLEKQNAIAFFELQPQDKLSSRLSKNQIPSWAIKQPNTIDVIVHFNKTISTIEAKEYLLYHQSQVVDESFSNYGFITVRIDQQKMYQFASIPFIEYIEPVAPDPKTFNYIMRANTKANVLNADVSLGGEGLKGRGVTIGIGDNADPSDHVDLKDRVINRAAGPQQIHGTHVAGIAAGGGLKDPLFHGVAPLATIVSQLFNGIFLNAAAYIADHQMVITNNSWGNITGECDLMGVYDTYSKLMDDISIQYPYLLNIFAAGNDGPFTCNGYPQQYHTVVSGHQSAKNVLSVGWSEPDQTVSAASSIGPTADGRLKPEITSLGSSVRSTAPNDDYFTDWGTSMAAPTVSGGAALLVEKYRQMNGGADPKSALIKALLMNGARDIENPAPDYRSGYGYLHLVRSLAMLKNNHFINSTITNGSINNHTINIPSGISQLKVLIYWHDPSAAIFAENALVNDMDVEVVTPASSTMLPWVLKSDSLSANLNATRAADHANNSEQVTINNPVAGNYTIQVKGTAINAGVSQEYFIIYDYVPTGVDLTNPSVREPLVPGENVIVSWDAWGLPDSDFTLQYSSDNGVNWNNINTTIPANARQYTWTVPVPVTDQARMRLIHNGTGESDISQAFTVISQPNVSLASVQCEGYISINWNTIPGATGYEVMMKRGVAMVPVNITTNTNYVFSGLNSDSIYWVTVRPMINNQRGRRAVAVSLQPNSGTCIGNISDNDLKADAIISPVSGRKFTSTEITANSIVVRIKNLDDAPVTNFAVKYSLNGNSFLSENVTAAIPANGMHDHTFNGINFSSPGNYNITAVVKNNVIDANTTNDTIKTTIRQLDNQPVILPYIEDFESAPEFEILKDTLGLPDLERWDFTNSTDTGRIRSFVNTGIAKSGNKSLTLDASSFILQGNANYLIGTFNLSNYSTVTAADLGLQLEFSYKHHGQRAHPNNRVWARRSDTDAWIQILNLDSLDIRAGEWNTVSVHLANTPAAISPTSSFQIRFGQHGFFPMGDNTSNAGITIDDVKLIASPYDVELISIETPVSKSCASNNNVPLTIKYKDHHGISGCIPIKFRINGGAIISECMVSGTSDIYTFNNGIDLSFPSIYQIEVWSDHPLDTYRRNDTLRLTVHNKPIINRFPYTENFENGTGNWHSEGHNSSWEFGTPASLKIKTAASGTKAWKTTLRGQYNENETSYLYSPCYDISGLVSPFLSFKMALDIEQCAPFICDKLWIEYSSNGTTWTKLGNHGQGVNWYNNSTENVWDSTNFTNWHLAAISLPPGLNIIQFRFVLESDAGVSREGIAIDDIHIYDNNIATEPQWQLNPNPTTGIIQLTSLHETGSTVNMVFFDALGKKIMVHTFTATGFLDQQTLNISHLSKGIYFVKVSDGDNARVFKMIKQ